MIVADASAVVDGLLDAIGHRALADCLAGARDSLAAPDLLDVEVLSVLRRWERTKSITAGRARQALDDLLDLPIIRYPSRSLLDRAWKLRHNIGAYDAQYVALAHALGARLLTTDAGMAQSAGRARVSLYALAT